MTLIFEFIKIKLITKQKVLYNNFPSCHQIKILCVCVYLFKSNIFFFNLSLKPLHYKTARTIFSPCRKISFFCWFCMLKDFNTLQKNVKICIAQKIWAKVSLKLSGFLKKNKKIKSRLQINRRLIPPNLFFISWFHLFDVESEIHDHCNEDFHFKVV